MRDIAPDTQPFMKRDAEWIERAELAHDAIARLLLVILRDKRTEETIPDDQHASVVRVEIFGVDGVVDAVMRGRVHYPFERAHPADRLGVNPELVDETDGREHQHHQRREADINQRQPEDKI